MMTATSHVLSVMDRERRAADAGTGSGSFPDVLIELRNGEVLHGHRCILSMCSPFFASQFNVAEEGKVLKLKLDEPPERIKKIIEIAYTGQLNYPDEKREPLDELVELLEVDQDNVAMFQTLISLLESDVKLENVYKTINIATRFNLKEIVEYCWDFIDDHALDIMSSDIICGVDYDKMMETVRCRTFQQSAIGVFKTMLKWQRAHPEYNMKYEDFFNVVATARMNVDDFDVSPAGELQSKIITEWAEKMKQMRALEAQVRQFCGGEENWPLPMSSKRILVNSSLTSYTSQQRFALWLNKAYSDLVLRDMKTADKLKTEEEEKEDEEVHAHRCILAAASSFFRQVFSAVAVIDEEEENDGEDNNNTEKEAVYLEGVSSMAFKQLVKFIYRGGLDLEELQIETIIEFYEMAQKYLDDEILSAMHDYLIADLRLENVYEVFVIAKQFNVEELLRPVWSFMHHNAIDIMYSDTLYYWQEEHLINVLSSSTFQEQPFYVFCAVRSFLEANPDAPRRKEMLDLVDLANIDEGDLIDAVGPSRLYSKRVIRSAIKKSKLRARQREKAAVEDTTTEEKPEEESK